MAVAEEVLYLSGLYAMHRPAVERAVRAQVRDRAVADDIVQEAFVRAFEQIERLRNTDSFLPWVLAIARNLVADHWRRTGRLVSLEVDDHDVASGASDVDDIAEVRELASRVTAKIRLLSPRDALALTLVSQLGFRTQEVAAVLGTSPGAARVALHRARGRLRDSLAEDSG